MPSAVAIHAACFAVGAVSCLRVVADDPSSTVPPIVEIGPTGDAKLPSAAVSGALVSPVLKYGHPGPVPDLLVRKAYTAAYDRRHRHPAWTAEHLTLASLGKSALLPSPDGSENGDRSKSIFTEDETLPVPFRAKLQDYFRSGYDRGHMYATTRKHSQEAMNETFLLSNIAPQVGDGFNRHYWAYVEDWCRTLTKVIGSPPNVSVPTHFAKVVLGFEAVFAQDAELCWKSRQGRSYCRILLIPDEAPFESFVAPVEAVERAAGLTLFSDAVKNASKHICQTTKCESSFEDFDEARKRPELRRTVSAPK
ncbi:hypothetical protein EDD16DRAFT_1693013 [Pisolithus croceorrhizus]|nr:hypothetical protein EDD16DRAFT_1693013 [Pisolithus croceorrhizus]